MPLKNAEPLIASLAALRRRIAVFVALAGMSLVLSGCLISDERIDLGPRAQPLPPGLYVSFDSKGEPEHAVVIRIAEDGRYVGEDFDVTLYESGVAQDVYFIAYIEEDEGRTLYGVAKIDGDALIYPSVVCKMVPATARDAAGLEELEDGCVIRSAAQGRAVLTALWRSMEETNKPATSEWMRFVRQTELRR